MKVFISYRRDDSRNQAGRICDGLKNRFKMRSVFLDVEDIQGGDNWRVTVEEKIRRCSVVLVVIGDNWLDMLRERSGGEDMVRREIEFALELGIPIIPVLVGQAPVPNSQDLPQTIQKLPDYNATPVRSGSDFSTDLAKLVAAIKAKHHSGILNPAIIGGSIAVLGGIALALVSLNSPQAENGIGESLPVSSPPVVPVEELHLENVVHINPAPGNTNTIDPSISSRGAKDSRSVPDIATGQEHPITKASSENVVPANRGPDQTNPTRYSSSSRSVTNPITAPGIGVTQPLRVTDQLPETGNSSNTGESLKVSINPELKVGERAELEITATRDVYICAVHISSNEFVTELFPGTTGQNGLLKVEDSKLISWETTPPGGPEHVIVFASSNPIRNTAIAALEVGDFKIVKKSEFFNTRGIPKAIQAVGESSSDLKNPILSEVRVDYILKEK